MAETSTSHDYVQDLLNESAIAWSELIDHPFPRELAKGTAPLNSFRHYLIQDATYLEYYYRMRTEAILKSGTFQEITEFAAKLPSSLQYVSDVRGSCTNRLGVPKGDVANEPKSQQLQNSIKLYEDVVRNSDRSWLDVHIVLLPCILGYYTIASKLLTDPETVKNTPYFPLWIEENASGRTAGKYRTLINSNIGNLSQEERDKRWSGWVDNFKKACGTEKAFFGLASPNVFQAYNIVNDGIYTIRSYRGANPYLVSTSPSSVTTQEAEPRDDGKWKLTNTSDGYVIQNVSQQTFLGVSVRDPTQPPYGVYVSDEEQKWSINAIQVPGEKEPHRFSRYFTQYIHLSKRKKKGPYQAYQLFVPNRLQFALDAGNNASEPKTFVTNNSQISSQLWLLEPVNGM